MGHDLGADLYISVNLKVRIDESKMMQAVSEGLITPDAAALAIAEKRAEDEELCRRQRD